MIAAADAAADRTVDVSFVVPVYRCAAALPELARRVRKVADGHGWRFELLLVDDASPDDALTVGRRLAAADAAVGVLRLDRNRGQQRALLAGLAVARGGWTVILDGDLQDPPEAAPRLLAAGAEGRDAVFAGRRGEYQRAGRMLTSRLFKHLQARLYGVPEDAGLCAALSRRTVDALVAMAGPRPRLLPMIGLTGLPTTSLPVPRELRRHGTSAYTAWRRLRSGVGALTYRWWRPLADRPAVDPAAWIDARYGLRRGWETP